MNSVNIIGRLTKDVELRTTQSGKQVASFSIAIDDGYGDNKRTYFINCVAWEKKAEVICKNLGKGSQVGISGKITTRNWDDNEGKKHYATEVLVSDITFCGSKGQASGESSTFEHDGFMPIDSDPDDLPF